MRSRGPADTRPSAFGMVVGRSAGRQDGSRQSAVVSRRSAFGGRPLAAAAGWTTVLVSLCGHEPGRGEQGMSRGRGYGRQSAVGGRRSARRLLLANNISWGAASSDHRSARRLSRPWLRVLCCTHHYWSSARLVHCCYLDRKLEIVKYMFTSEKQLRINRPERHRTDLENGSKTPGAPNKCLSGADAGCIQ